VPLVSALRRLLRLEDLLGAVWLAVLSPVSGDLFLEGGLATIVLALAALGWWLAVLLRERAPEGGTPAGPHVLFGSIAVAAIMIDAACKQLDHRELQLPTTIAFVVLTVVALAQHRFTPRTFWPSLPRWVRRAVGWPFILVMAESFGQISEIVLPTPARGYLGDDAGSLGELLFMITFGIGVLAVVYAFFVVMPRRVLDPRDPAEPSAWALRFLAALASTLAGAWIAWPLWDRLVG
jgi:hypothetical protein